MFHKSQDQAGSKQPPSEKDEQANLTNNKKGSQTMNAQQNAQAKEEAQNADNNQQPQQQQGRPAQAGPSRVPGAAYPGAYPSSTTSSYAPPSASANDAENGRKLVVGRGISMSGEIDACDHLIVEGTIEAALKGASVLDIEETGVFYGTVEIDEATVSGRFEGDLTVNGRLTITSTGSITGSIAYKELAIEAGAVLDGKVSPLEVRAQGQKVAEGNFKGKRGAEGDEQLPFSDKAAANAAE